jgi:hypothetical protein
VGTIVAEGKEIREFDGEQYVMERALVPEVSLVKAHRADKSGNLQFRLHRAQLQPRRGHGRQDLRGGSGRDCGDRRRWCPTRSTCPAFTCTASC